MTQPLLYNKVEKGSEGEERIRVSLYGHKSLLGVIGL